MEELQNYGFIPLGPGRTDFLAGAIPFEVRVPSGQHDDFLPEKELQRVGSLDVMACVSFANINASVETQINWMIMTGLLKPGDLAYDFLKDNGYFINGKVQTSKRFLAKVSLTGTNGNTLQRVADAARHFGFIPESKWAWTSDINTWNEYYSAIPQDLLNLGKRFLTYFDIQYEWIGDNRDEMKHHLQHAPLQIASSTCWGWSDGGIIKACNGSINHSTMIYGYEDGKFWKDFDHYLDVLGDVKKKLAWDYNIPYIMKIIITKKKIIMSDTTTALNLLKRLPHLQVAITPNLKGEIWLMDCSKGQDSWKYHVQEGFVAQQLKYRALGIPNDMANAIRTIDTIEEVKYLYE